MYTIIDYLNYYKDIKIEDVHINAMDNLLCATLAYLPVESFEGKKNLQEFMKYSKEFENKKDYGTMGHKAYIMLDIIKKSKRYEDLVISNFVNYEDKETQFGAVKFILDDNIIIAFKGTDGGAVSWYENLRLGYKYPTNTQIMSLKYLEENISLLDKNVYVTGHSKGGNSALTSVMEAPDYIFYKIKKVYNFDGPGVLTKEFNSSKFKRLSSKLVNIVPTGSVVGVLLNNTEYQVVQSNDYAINEHFPTSWKIFGEVFIPGELSSVSKKLHESTTVNLENLSQEKVEGTIETIIENIEKSYDPSRRVTFNDMKVLLKNMKNLDPEVTHYLNTMVSEMVKDANNE